MIYLRRRHFKGLQHYDRGVPGHPHRTRGGDLEGELGRLGHRLGHHLVEARESVKEGAIYFTLRQAPGHGCARLDRRTA